MITAKEARRISDSCAISSIEKKVKIIEEEIIRAANSGFSFCTVEGMNEKMIVDALEKAGYKVTINAGEMRIRW